jgi:hypothetical protein
MTRAPSSTRHEASGRCYSGLQRSRLLCWTLRLYKTNASSSTPIFENKERKLLTLVPAAFSEKDQEKTVACGSEDFRKKIRNWCAPHSMRRTKKNGFLWSRRPQKEKKKLVHAAFHEKDQERWFRRLQKEREKKWCSPPSMRRTRKKRFRAVQKTAERKKGNKYSCERRVRSVTAPRVPDWPSTSPGRSLSPPLPQIKRN